MVKGAGRQGAAGEVLVEVRGVGGQGVAGEVLEVVCLLLFAGLCVK